MAPTTRKKQIPSGLVVLSTLPLDPRSPLMCCVPIACWTSKTCYAPSHVLMPLHSWKHQLAQMTSVQVHLDGWCSSPVFWAFVLHLHTDLMKKNFINGFQLGLLGSLTLVGCTVQQSWLLVFIFADYLYGYDYNIIPIFGCKQISSAMLVSRQGHRLCDFVSIAQIRKTIQMVLKLNFFHQTLLPVRTQSIPYLRVLIPHPCSDASFLRCIRSPHCYHPRIGLLGDVNVRSINQQVFTWEPVPSFFDASLQGTGGSMLMFKRFDTWTHLEWNRTINLSFLSPLKTVSEFYLLFYHKPAISNIVVK